ncbi:MAG: hypothetical protein ACD_75C02320G0002 [uncultured bacterium]|nr:MAG: hypothetical protein ACD_75C02320G0002 [uncultured bacterium]
MVQQGLDRQFQQFGAAGKNSELDIVGKELRQALTLESETLLHPSFLQFKKDEIDCYDRKDHADREVKKNSQPGGGQNGF